MGNQHQNNSDYEKMWKEAFDHAEMSPSDDLWDKIDTQLTRQESGAYKKRFLFYRAVAAACLLCLLGLGIFTASHYYEDKPQQPLSVDSQQQAPQPAALNPEADGQTNSTNETNTQQHESQSPFGRHSASDNLANKQSLTQGKEKSDIEQAYAGNSSKENTSNSLKGKTVHKQLHDEATQSEDVYPSKSGSQVASVLSRAVASGWHDMPVNFSLPMSNEPLYKVPNPYAAETQEAVEEGPVFFAGLDLSGNYFDPNFQSPSMNANADMAPASLLDHALYSYAPERAMYASPERTPGAESTPQISFSYGMDMGVNLTKHLSVQSGIDYGRFNTSTMTNMGLKSLTSREKYPLTVSNMSNLSADQGISYTDYTSLTSSFELLTIPLKIGYHVIFNKLQLFLSSGMAANFFLNNRISDESGQLNTVNVQAGPESIYRKVFYSGIISGGLNYNVTGNYLIKIAPEYSFSVSEMTQEGSFISSQPFLFGMNFGITYQFK